MQEFYFKAGSLKCISFWQDREMATFDSIFTMNCLYWLVSLPEDQLGPSRRLLEDLSAYFSSQKLPFKIKGISTAFELLETLNNIREVSMRGYKPIIHFDMHGNEDGLLISGSEELLLWDDLCNALRQINVATQNNLCVISAVCHSLHLIDKIKVSEPAPLYLLIAPRNEVSFGFLEDNISKFYRSAFDHENIVQAYEDHLSPVFHSFHIEKLFVNVLAKYFREDCMGQNRQTRIETLLTDVMSSSNVQNNRYNRRKARHIIKKGTKPRIEDFERFKRVFLMDRETSITFKTVLDLLSSGK